MGCAKSKPQDVAIGTSFSKSRTAKSTKTSLSDNNKNSATTVNVAPVEGAVTATVVYDHIPEKSPVVVVEDTKLEEEPPAYSVVSDTTKPEESPVYTVVLDTKSEESPVFALDSDKKLEESPVETTSHVVTDTKPVDSPVYTVVSDTNSEDSPAYTLVSDTKPKEKEESIVSDTKPEETFLMSNWVDDAMDIVTKTEKPPSTETEEDVNIINSDNNVVTPANESYPVQDLVMTSEPTPKESHIAAAGDDEDVKEEETAAEFDDAQTTILPIHEEDDEEEENNTVKADEKETIEENVMKSEASFDKEDHKEIKEKTVIVAEEAN